MHYVGGWNKATTLSSNHGGIPEVPIGNYEYIAINFKNEHVYEPRRDQVWDPTGMNNPQGMPSVVVTCT